MDDVVGFFHGENPANRRQMVLRMSLPAVNSAIVDPANITCLEAAGGEVIKHRNGWVRQGRS